MKFVVIGYGSIGARHIKNLLALGNHQVIGVDPYPSPKINIKIYPTIKSAFKNHLDIAAGLVCSPTHLHIKHATILAQHGIHLFIEKPLSHNMQGIKKLQQIVNRKKLITMMGMCYRFDKSLMKVEKTIKSGKIGKIWTVRYWVGHWLPDWHPNKDYRQEYSAQKKMGGGVTLTSIHGINTIRWLFGEIKTLKGFSSRVSDLEIDTDDVASATMLTDKGILVNMYSDFLQPKQQHEMWITGSRGTLHWKWGQEKNFDINQMYIDELKHFLSCLCLKKQPKTPLIEGIRDLTIARQLKLIN